MTGLSFGALLLVILSGPFRMWDGVKCPFTKGLAQELRTGPSPVNPPLFAAGGNHWRNAALALNLTGCLIPVTLSAKSRDQPRGQRRSGSLLARSPIVSARIERTGRSVVW
jgi:hypothetical protein